MNQPDEYEVLLATRWVRELNETEQARLNQVLETAPDLRQRWEDDMALLEGLHSMPDVAVSSNFTSQVVSRLEQKVGPSPESTPREAELSWLQRLGFVPRLGLGFALGLAVFGSFLQYQRGGTVKMVESLTAVSESETVPTLEELQHFDAIQMLAQVPVDVDWELITASE